MLLLSWDVYFGKIASHIYRKWLQLLKLGVLSEALWGEIQAKENNGIIFMDGGGGGIEGIWEFYII